MKVIFLGFDGPIIPLASHQHRRVLAEKAWPLCIGALNRITRVTGAKIVVSSTWRFGGVEYVRNLLHDWGATGEVIAITPVMPEHERGQEIAAWLGHNAVESFVILDDDADMCHLMHYLIQTPFEEGLTELDADRAIAMLGVSL